MAMVEVLSVRVRPVVVAVVQTVSVPFKVHVPVPRAMVRVLALEEETLATVMSVPLASKLPLVTVRVAVIVELS